MNETRIMLYYDFENLNQIINTSRANFYKANSIKKKEMQYIRTATLDIEKIKEYPVKITFIWHVKDKRRDLDNMVAKNILDGLVNAKVIENDNLKYISEITYKAVIDNQKYVEVIIEKA